MECQHKNAENVAATEVQKSNNNHNKKKSKNKKTHTTNQPTTTTITKKNIDAASRTIVDNVQKPTKSISKSSKETDVAIITATATATATATTAINGLVQHINKLHITNGTNGSGNKNVPVAHSNLNGHNHKQHREEDNGSTTTIAKTSPATTTKTKSKSNFNNSNENLLDDNVQEEEEEEEQHCHIKEEAAKVNGIRHAVQPSAAVRLMGINTANPTVLSTAKQEFACNLDINSRKQQQQQNDNEAKEQKIDILATATAAAAIDLDTDDDGDTVTDLVIEAQPTTLALAHAVVNIKYTEYQSELQMHDIMRLIQAELSEPYSIYTYRYFIYNWPKLCFLAAHENEYVGAIVCKLDMHQGVKRGYIAMLAVRKEYRNLRIGTTLVQKAIEAMLADNADEVVLETEMRNYPALHLYENLGFVRDKRLFRYYLNGVDALRLKLWFR